MKYLIAILCSLIGFFTVKGLNHFGVDETPKTTRQKCVEVKPREDQASQISVGNRSSSQCLSIIPNIGMKHDRSEAMSNSKIFSFFNEQLKDFHNEPNEFNVTTNDSDFGKSSQKYDPRDDLYIRFEKVKTFDKKAKYGLVSGFQNAKEVLKSKICSPEFNMISAEEKLDISKYLRDMKIQFKKSASFHENEYEDFTFLRMFDILEIWNEDFLKRYKIFRNNCNKALSVLVNFCVVNPKYDLQYEDMFVLKDKRQLVSNVYCKSTNEKQWTLLKTHIFSF